VRQVVATLDADADFVDFVSARWPRLCRMAYLLTGGDECAAEDLLQGAMEQTYARWTRVRRMEAPEAYIRRVMVNAMISERRRPGWRRESLRAVVPEVSPLPEGSGVVDHALVWPLVCALPERQRAVVVLRYYEDLSEAETADVLDCAVGTVKSQAHHALQALRRGLVQTSKQGEVLER
jgi:RNA polymerase sigma-70 factor (sigma-E family)